MKVGYIIAVLAVLLLIVGCKTTEEVPAPTAPSAPVEEPEVVDEVVEEAKPSDDINIDTTTLSDADQDAIERYKKACDAGNAGLCAALKRMEERLGVKAEEVIMG